VATASAPGGHDSDHGSGISMSDDGRFVYTGLRGSGRIGVFKVGRNAKTLEAVTSVSSGGDWPRHHAIDGDELHVANQLSNSIASFHLGADGVPVPIGSTVAPSPSYLLRVR
jgi:6-phosphogluconolactonase (cycloisomerase 2 family)